MSTEARQPVAGFLERLFAGLEESGVRHAVMRNYEGLPHATGGSDLDILIDPRQERGAREVIRRAITEAGGEAIGLASSSGFFKVYAFGRGEGSGGRWWGLRIDVSVGLRYLGCAELLSEHVLDRRVIRHNGVCVLPSDLASVIGVLKELLYNGVIPGRYIAAAAAAMRTNPRQIQQDLAPMGASALELLFEVCAKSSMDAESALLIRKFRKQVLVTAFRRNPFEFAISRLRLTVSRIRRVWLPPGKVIAFLGTDGAGKSTMIEAVLPVLKEATHGDVAVLHLRPGLLPPLSRLKGGGPEQRGPVLDPHGKPPSGRIGSFLRVFYLLADHTLGYWWKIRPMIARAPGVVVFDRYMYDLLIDPGRLRVCLPDWLIRSLVWLVPTPHLIICLSGNPSEIAARKKELPLSEVQRQVQAIERFATLHNRAVLVRTDGTIEKARDEVLEALKTACGR